MKDTFATVAARLNQSNPDQGEFIPVLNKRDKKAANNARSRVPAEVSSKHRPLRRLTTKPPVEIFITRLHPDSTVDDIKQYAIDQINVVITCEQLVTKYDTYTSFKVIVVNSIANQLLPSEFWPTNVFVRKFYKPRSNNSTYDQGNRVSYRDNNRRRPKNYPAHDNPENVDWWQDYAQPNENDFSDTGYNRDYDDH